MVLLAAPLGAVLPAAGSLLLGPKLPGADEQRRPPTAPPALPPRRNPGAAAGPAALHHPGAVSVVESDSPRLSVTGESRGFCGRPQVPGRRAALPRLPSRLGRSVSVLR